MMDIKEDKNIAAEIENNKALLTRYVELLIAANTRARLTGPSDAHTLWQEHIMDCAAGLPLLPASGSIADVGTGGGLPGIVWAICRPDLHITLIDSIGRKCALIEEITDQLGLKNTRVCCTRSEDLAKKSRESFQMAAARAVCAAGILAEYLSPLVAVEGTLLLFKGPRVTEELANVTRPWSVLGLSDPILHPYHLNDRERSFLLFKKTAPCPTGYPRRPGLAEKSPWYELSKETRNHKRKPS